MYAHEGPDRPRPGRAPCIALAVRCARARSVLENDFVDLSYARPDTCTLYRYVSAIRLADVVIIIVIRIFISPGLSNIIFYRL